MKKILLLILFILLSCHSHATEKYFALSSSGGISLGSYQSGRLYYQNYFLMKNNLVYAPSVFTGASAGSINSLLSLMDICQNNPKDPFKSLYWNTWVPVGFKSLIPKKRSSPTAMFTNEVLVKIGQEIKAEWLKGFDKNCTMYLGVPITLKKPDVLQLGPSLAVQRQLLPIILKISGNGPNKAPSIENLNPQTKSLSSPRLFLDKDGGKQFDSLLNVLLASAAFPGAFPSQKVRVCLDAGTTCKFDESQELDFIDGGIYENQPIKLAHLIKKRLDPNDKRVPIIYRHVDADGRGYPAETQGPTDSENSFLKTMMQSGLSFLDTSRNQELYTFIQEFPEIRKKIISTVSQFPRASDPWGAFFGFFDVGFREFDFLLGIYESEKETSQINDPHFKTAPSYHIKDDEIGQPGSWRRYSCLRQYLSGVDENDRDKICNGSEVRNLLILAQVSLWRLYYTCHQTGIEIDKWVGCQSLSAWRGVPVIIEDFNDKIVIPKMNQDSAEYFIKALTQLNYKFDPKEFHENSTPDEQLRLKLQLIVDRLAERQEGDEKRAVKGLGTVALNFYRYLYPERNLYATFGDLSEFGFSSRKIPWIRKFDKFSFNIALQTNRGQEIFEGKNNNSTFAPLIGGIYPLSGISDGRIQYSLGMGGGYIFSNAHIRGGVCDDSKTICNGIFVRPFFGISFMNIFQVNLYQRFGFSAGDKKSDTNLSLGFNHSF